MVTIHSFLSRIALQKNTHNLIHWHATIVALTIKQQKHYKLLHDKKTEEEKSENETQTRIARGARRRPWREELAQSYYGLLLLFRHRLSPAPGRIYKFPAVK
jgi:hypothetical protein